MQSHCPQLTNQIEAIQRARSSETTIMIEKRMCLLCGQVQFRARCKNRRPLPTIKRAQVMMARDNSSSNNHLIMDIRCMSRIMLKVTTTGVLVVLLLTIAMVKILPTMVWAGNLHPSKDTCSIRQVLRKLKTILAPSLEECKQTLTIKRRQAVDSIET